MTMYLSIIPGINFSLIEGKKNSLFAAFQGFNIFSFFILCFWISSVKSKNGELCVVVPQLQTPYLMVYEETSSYCTGCVFHPSSAPAAAAASDDHVSRVHVVQADHPDDSFVELTLDISAASENKSYQALVLCSTSSGTTFFISVLNEEALRNFAFSFVIAGDVKLTVQSPLMEYKSVRKDLWSSEDIIANSKKHFGFVSSYTQTDVANRISLNLHTSGKERLNSCTDATSLPSSLATCSRARRQEISGCFHQDMIGVEDSDIHIIEVDGSYNSNNSILLHVTGMNSFQDSDISNGRHSSVTGSPFSVDTNDIEIGESKRGSFSSATQSRMKRIGALLRNLTIILKSAHPTTWTLKVTNIQGIISLFVGDGDQVENTSSAGQSLSLSVKSIDLPKRFDGLILKVLSNFGAPISYTKAKNPNLIRMVVPYNHEMTQAFFEPQQAPNPETLDWEMAYTLVKESVSVFCLEHDAYVSLPLEVSKKIGGVEMSFNDRSCPATHNSTHITIASKFTNCGFTMQQLDDSTELYTNFVQIDMGTDVRHPFTSDDEDDYEGSAFAPEGSSPRKLPVEIVQCKRVSSPPFFEELNGGNLEAEYKLQLFHDLDLRKPFRKHEFPLVFKHKVTLHAKLGFWQGDYHMSEGSGIRIIIEECLLSKSLSALSNPVTLIRKSCGVQPYVSTEIITNDIVFHFQISNEYANNDEIYLHCQVGVCADGALPRPSINKCVDPATYCQKEKLLNIFSNQPMGSLLKTIVAGPFIRQASNKVHSDLSIFAKKGQTRDDYGNKDKTPIVVMEGLSTQVVVGIAIAAFVIGICLMATLWVIYMKTDPRHQMRPKNSVPRNCGYDLSGHSGSSTPSSQAPMTA